MYIRQVEQKDDLKEGLGLGFVATNTPGGSAMERVQKHLIYIVRYSEGSMLLWVSLPNYLNSTIGISKQLHSWLSLSNINSCLCCYCPPVTLFHVIRKLKSTSKVVRY
ncbi:hypothetical protein ATANTOWER_013937 [Ataeniobius toweri]|uniref:Uncharacterized protein n=1 Tax=Ataeniobius toweri TaxID=208326 RepID=A0ABU7BJQ4_9TELE|nr:hypothetical protein [Ataeniobius toweri]